MLFLKYVYLAIVALLLVAEMLRNTGEVTLVSENYLTWKRQVTRSNAFTDDPVTEKWSRLSKKPLEKLGEREL